MACLQDPGHITVLRQAARSLLFLLEHSAYLDPLFAAGRRQADFESIHDQLDGSLQHVEHLPRAAPAHSPQSAQAEAPASLCWPDMARPEASWRDTGLISELSLRIGPYILHEMMDSTNQALEALIASATCQPAALAAVPPELHDWRLRAPPSARTARHQRGPRQPTRTPGRIKATCHSCRPVLRRLA